MKKFKMIIAMAFTLLFFILFVIFFECQWYGSTIISVLLMMLSAVWLASFAKDE